MAWLLDTNVLVNAKRDHYGFEFCPGFWDWLDIAWADGRVASVEAVYDELVDYGDQLSDWARDHRSFFLAPGAAEVSAMATVNGWAAASDDYTLAAKQEFAAAADSCSHCLRDGGWAHRRHARTPGERAQADTGTECLVGARRLLRIAVADAARRARPVFVLQGLG